MNTSDKARLQAFASDEFQVRLREGRVESIRSMQEKNAVEHVSPKWPFGDINLLLECDGAQVRLTTRGLAVADLACEHRNSAQACFVFDEVPGLKVSVCYSLNGHAFMYGISLRNEGNAALTVLDLSIPFAINNDFAWGEDATQRVLRHSFIAGDNSYLYFAPTDGHAPYLLCTPLQGTRMEFYDTRADRKEEEEEHRGTYQVYLHAAGEEKAAAQKGCRWRQPVSSLVLESNTEATYGLQFQFARDERAIRETLCAVGLLDIRIAPGMTVPRERPVRMAISSVYPKIAIGAEYPDSTTISLLRHEGQTSVYEVSFSHLGENKLILSYGEGRESLLEFFVTLPVRELVELRARFISQRQIRDDTKWFDGVLAEWNNRTGARLSPDFYDLIKGWRIYEVTCDDPGLSKPAFLASKNAEYPEPDEVDALEYYIERFVWGGLQNTEEEEYAYGIYGIPDWSTLRRSEDPGPKGRTHIWRVYDYPHVALMYYKMYRIGKRAPGMLKQQTAQTYLKRAYRTMLAMYQYPAEIDDWSAYKTGFYNELVITEIMQSLRDENMPEQAQRLAFHWQRKAKYFVTACNDLFGSEYPFDTTGTESTQALANWALANAKYAWQEDPRDKPDYTQEQAHKFYRYQLQCNIACRGTLENAYYLLGSDYRNCSAHYTLSYMSQMGGCAILEDALYHQDDPAERLRLGYASLLSSWALMNAGDAKSNYGYWFPGPWQNGAAGGGFENAPYGYTWLDQPHSRGSWYYSCEIDLGYCGALRGMATVWYDDPLLGEMVYGGRLDGGHVVLEDGVQRRFHHLAKDRRVHILVDNARMERVERHGDAYTVWFEAVDEAASLVAEWPDHRACIGETELAIGEPYPLPRGNQSITVSFDSI